ncbi:two-component sensor histidine kinase [Streptomyces sp. GMY02]|uniref:sensor histidine kinase n=1 Tax=Streptomyces sp. GMY02 TaxID=1333528 RepID=UPI001C2C22FC|nr:histidine kinase [Streptomyces sp. GMY02]QXE34641.1 two-component sensor histidine kinase [Streptomyces sp. GMY02]
MRTTDGTGTAGAVRPVRSANPMRPESRRARSAGAVRSVRSIRPAHTVRSLLRGTTESWAALRRAPRRTVAAEALGCLLTAALGLIPLLLVPPDRPVLAVLEALYAVFLMPLRRGRPFLAVVGTAPLLVGPNVWVLAVAPLIVLSATRRIAPPRRAWHAVWAACALAAVLTIAERLFRPGAWAEELAGNGVSAVLLVLLPALSGVLLGRRRPLVSLLRERNAYLEQARSLTAATARLEERTRIAGEMHDLLGHRLSLISVHAGALELAAARQAPPLAGQAELLRTTAGTAMEELRDILGLLRREDTAAPVPEPDANRGTREDITALVAESRQAGVTVELDWSLPDTAEPGPRTRQSLHRVVREGLTNVLKHASGAPTRVEVGIAPEGRGRAPARIEVSVTNEAPRAGRHQGSGSRSGLAGLEERIALLGGSFVAGPLPDGGFRLAAVLPCRPDGTTLAVPLPGPVPPARHRTRAGSRTPVGHPAHRGQPSPCRTRSLPGHGCWARAARPRS